MRNRLRPFVARVTIRKIGESYESSIVSADGTSRALNGATCEEVADATYDVQPAHDAAPKPEAKDNIAKDIAAMVSA